MVPIRRRIVLRPFVITGAVLAFASHAPMAAHRRVQAGPSQAHSDATHAVDFVASYDARGLIGLSAPRDPSSAQVLAPGARLASS